MAQHVDQVNINDEMITANTFNIKEEQRQEDSFIEKVNISEAALTIDTVDIADIQGPKTHGKIKQDDESICLNNIKIELASFEVIEVQNGNVKTEGGLSANDLKIEYDNGLLYCELCEAYYKDYCIECGMLVNILNKNSLTTADSETEEDIPNNILEIKDCFGKTGIYALKIIPAGVKFGPFTGLSTTEYPWEVKGVEFILNKSKSKYFNWMQYINPSRNTCDRNLHVFQFEDNIYYQCTRQIQAGEELLVYFGEEYRNSPNKIIGMNFFPTMKDNGEDIFACTFCCLGFGSKSHLAKHKTICVEDTSGTFSSDELTQCPFCKIHLDTKEYFEQHMAFCCERNGRKCILPTPHAKQATNCQAYIKERTKPHYEVKIYKCGICKRSSKTKESLRLHLEKAHAFVGGKNVQEYSTTDYRKTHIKLGQTSSQNQKQIFKCLLCVFQAKYKQSLKRHIETKHSTEFDIKCDSCEYSTSNKRNLEYHIKTKHLQKFDFKCDRCEFRTTIKTDLKRHIKTKHLKKFDYKCDKCEFGTNFNTNLKRHIKTKHLMQFDYKCNVCEFRTNYKTDLKRHIKTKHLKEFDHKCDKCGFRTNRKHRLEIHMKQNHF